MKIAVSGKGGVGKTLLSALLALKFARDGYSVLAIDADPDANLAATLGFPDPDKIVPISEMADLIEERTGARPGQPGTLFKLNPKVEDIPEKYAVVHRGVRIMVMGRLKRGGSGCYCPENALLQALITHLLLRKNEVVILDMAAGIEHLGRATARAVNVFIVVIEPGRKSIDTAIRIKELASDIGVNTIVAVGNKVRSTSDQEYLVSNLSDIPFIGFVPYDQSIIDADISGRDMINSVSESVNTEIGRVFRKLIDIVPDKSIKNKNI